MTPFRIAAFRWLWASTTAATAAQGMERTATAWLALEAGGGALGVGAVFAARMLPSLLLGLPAGTIADRNDRRRQLLAVALAALPMMLALGWLAGSGGLQIWQVVLVTFAIGCIQVFDAPARQALVLDVVPREVAANAVALNALASRLFAALGAFAGGFLILEIGVAGTYNVVAAIYLLAGLLAVLLRAPAETRAGSARPPFRTALRDAARLIVDVPAVRTLTIAAIACEVFGFSYQTTLPVVARDVLLAGPEGLGTLNGAASIGGTIAVVLLSFLPSHVRREPVLGGVFVLYGAALLALARTGDLMVAAAVLVVIGACAGAFDVLQQTLIQLAAPEEQRGRAVGIWVLSIGSAPVGHLETGALVAAVGAPLTLAVNGVLVLVAAAILLVRAPMYRWLPRAAPPAT